MEEERIIKRRARQLRYYHKNKKLKRADKPKVAIINIRVSYDMYEELTKMKGYSNFVRKAIEEKLKNDTRTTNG